MNPLAQKIGIIGGGQLGKMMLLAAKRMGFYSVIIDPTPDCPAHSLADQHIVAGFKDQQAIRELAGLCDVLTFEIEHIDADVLMELEAAGTKVFPTPRSLKIIQDKLTQKKKLDENQIPVPLFTYVKEVSDIYCVGEKWGYPLVLKTCLGGYDGRGNYLIKTKEDVETAYKTLGGGSTPLMVETFMPFVKELSVLAARGIDGSVRVYPVAENIHSDNILRRTVVPAGIREESTKAAMDCAYKVMEIFEGVGMFCVEMFLLDDGSVWVNEVAPRPHNSGHYSIEACYTSQFEQHVRAITGLPLGDVSLIKPAVMVNLLGEAEGPSVVLGLDKGLSHKGLALHVYGKAESKPKRKMGHFTVLADSLEEATSIADLAEQEIIITGVQNG